MEAADPRRFTSGGGGVRLRRRGLPRRAAEGGARRAAKACPRERADGLVPAARPPVERGRPTEPGGPPGTAPGRPTRGGRRRLASATGVREGLPGPRGGAPEPRPRVGPAVPGGPPLTPRRARATARCARVIAAAARAGGAAPCVGLAPWEPKAAERIVETGRGLEKLLQKLAAAQAGHVEQEEQGGAYAVPCRPRQGQRRANCLLDALHDRLVRRRRCATTATTRSTAALPRRPRPRFSMRRPAGTAMSGTTVAPRWLRRVVQAQFKPVGIVTPLEVAVQRGDAACVAVLRAGATPSTADAYQGASAAERVLLVSATSDRVLVTWTLREIRNAKPADRTNRQAPAPDVGRVLRRPGRGGRNTDPQRRRRGPRRRDPDPRAVQHGLRRPGARPGLGPAAPRAAVSAEKARGRRRRRGRAERRTLAVATDDGEGGRAKVEAIGRGRGAVRIH